MNPVEHKLFHEGGVRVIAEPREPEGWLITDVVYSMPGAKIHIHAPVLIPSIEWLGAALKSNQKAVTAIEKQYE